MRGVTGRINALVSRRKWGWDKARRSRTGLVAALFAVFNFISTAAFAQNTVTDVSAAGVCDTYIPVTGVTLLSDDAKVGIPFSLMGVVMPSHASVRAITWSVVDPGTAGAAIENGYALTTSATGSVTVRATVVSGRAVGIPYAQDFKITVKRNILSVTEIMDVPEEVVAGYGVRHPLMGTVFPSYATNRLITWSVADPGTTGAGVTCYNTAYESGCELIVPSPGVVTVMATIVDGEAEGKDFTQEFDIVVNPPPETVIPVIHIELWSFSADAGIPFTLPYTPYPIDATYKGILWTISDPGTTGARIINGRELIASAPGTVHIQACVTDASAGPSGYPAGVNCINSLNYPITVNPKYVANIPIERIEVSLYREDTSLSAGLYTHIIWTVVPPNATNQLISWSIENEGTTGAIIENGNVLNVRQGEQFTSGKFTIVATVIGGGDEYGESNYRHEINYGVTRAGITVNDLIYDLSPVTYNSQPQGILAPEARCGIILGAITVKYNGVEDEPTNAGTYVVTADIAVSGNYDATGGLFLGEFTIKRKPVTTTMFMVDSKPYDGTTAATMDRRPIYAESGVVGGDEVILIMAGGEFASPNAGKGIPVTARLSLGGRDAANYMLDTLSVLLTGDITPKELTIPGAYVEPKEYDGTVHARIFDNGLEGVVPGEESAVTLEIINARFAAPNASDTGIPVTAQMALTGAAAANYILIIPTLTGYITPKPLPPLPLIMPQIYTGLTVIPKLNIMDGAVALIPGVDYKVSECVSCDALGSTAAVTVIGIGNYKDTLPSAEFRIVRGRGARLFIGPNPALSRAEAAEFYWQGHNFGTSVLYIYDKAGNIIKEIDIRDDRPIDDVSRDYDARSVGKWDLTNTKGRYVAAGTYLIKGVLVTADGTREGKREKISQLIGVR
ncbi:MAG: YDG domain-containing protein [Chitinispirillia bacterium]|nr:YDG domain-containing protein [Chitinispirillia bacterium]